MKFLSVAVMVLGACNASAKEPALANAKNRNSWSVDARKCVASADSPDELSRCGKQFTLGEGGVFAEHRLAREAMQAMSGFKVDMCACKDSACAQKVADDMTKWADDQVKGQRAPPRLSDEEVKAFTQVGEDLGKCMQTALGSGTP